MAEPLKEIYVTLEYGVERDYWISPTHTGRDYRLHQGTGTPVYACQRGRVLHAGWGGLGSSYGNHVVIEHKTPFNNRTVRVIYAHLNRSSVGVGSFVEKGAKIGEGGGTGNVTAPHLHLEQRHYPFGYWDNEVPTVTKDRLDPSAIIRMFYVRRKRIGAVKKIQEALKRKYPNRDVRVNGKWDEPTKRTYQHHQESLYGRGPDADGEPGPDSLENLGFKVKRGAI
jgi:murein DD-endopeptidase MepM/ murein hydrolase activator NlpD